MVTTYYCLTNYFAYLHLLLNHRLAIFALGMYVLITYHLPLTTHYLPLTTYYSLLTTCYLLLTTYYLLLTN
jgi:hypothetical protein